MEKSEEIDIQEQLAKAFPFMADKITITRARRIFADVPADKFAAVFDRAVKQMGFSILCSITGLDQGQTLGFIYHMARTSGVMLNLSTSVPKDAPVLQTVTGYFPQADCYERELNDLLGAQVQGLPPGNRYPLPDNWPANQYPLRKDWKAECLQSPSAAAAPETPPKEADHV